MNKNILILLAAGLVPVFCQTTFSQENQKSSGNYFNVQNPAAVTEMDLRNKDIKIFPMEIFEMKNLKTLDLSNNDLDGLPAEIKNLRNLKVLKLDGNNIYELPEEISRLKLLKEIYLDYFMWCYRLADVKKLTNARIILTY